jgi:hypothetical protein
VHDPDYRASLADFNSFIEKLTEKVMEIDDTVPELPLKDIVSAVHRNLQGFFIRPVVAKLHKVFRIHRDVRFSKDQTPYKVSRRALYAA